MNLIKRLHNIWKLSKYEMPTDTFYNGFVEATQRALKEKPHLAEIIHIKKDTEKIISDLIEDK